MGKTSISWTDYTLNFWIGCHKVSEGCKFCYAENYSDRYKLAVWGNEGTRHITSSKNWQNAFAWNNKAKEDGIRYRVFTSSLSDIMEDRDELIETRNKMFEIIENTPNLDWLLLTKRPQNFDKFIPDSWKVEKGNKFPSNVWLGASICNQRDYTSMFPYIQQFCEKNNVPVMFISCEPLVGKINFNINLEGRQPDQIIIGGESGFLTKVRKLELEYVKSIINQFQGTDTKIFFKQLGTILSKMYNFKDKKGEDFNEYPNHLSWLMIREIPEPKK